MSWDALLFRLLINVVFYYYNTFQFYNKDNCLLLLFNIVYFVTNLFKHKLYSERGSFKNIALYFIMFRLVGLSSKKNSSECVWKLHIISSNFWLLLKPIQSSFIFIYLLSELLFVTLHYLCVSLNRFQHSKMSESSS